MLLTGLLDDAGGVAESIGANDYDEGFCIVASTNPILTFAHEIGHLFGAEHNISSASPIPFRMYGHGNRFETTNGNKYRTVMAYNNSAKEYSTIPYWSNPNINYQGTPTGTNRDDVACVAATAIGGIIFGPLFPIGAYIGNTLACKSSNNARVLNEQFPTLAGLFPFIQNVAVPPQTVNNNNVENITAHNITSNLPYTIESGSEVTFHARDQIRISGNFRAKSGSFFRATRVNFTDCNPQSNTGRFEATESAEHIDKVYTTGSRITISPNPTTSKVHLTTGFDGESEIVLTDIAGKTLQTFNTTSNETDIDLSVYSNGMYFFKITNHLGKHIAKVMKIVEN